ncbi:MAG TPA: hypothetical protein VFV19_16360 [Candidatus Polarisedimenticolaceae bacterium]|nr:hypothetical protein [Candidatus Polarisedimenticolaceae bacterium]
MHKSLIAVGTLVLSIGAVLAAPAFTVTEDFEGTVDDASWRSSPQDQIVATGGNPGAYLDAVRDSAEPVILTIPAHAAHFLGNYRGKVVSNLGIDVAIFDVGISADGRPVSLHLLSDMNTPDDPTDDCEIAVVSTKTLPRSSRQWRSFDFNVPSLSNVLPKGWQVVSCPGLTDDAAWNAVITHVSQASFAFGEPGFFYFDQTWNIGYDNARISFGKGAIQPPF